MGNKTDISDYPQHIKRLFDWFGTKKFSEIGRKIGMSDQTISDYAHGKIKIPPKLTEYIVRNGGNVNYILTGETAAEGAEAPARPADPGLTDDERFLVEQMRNMTVDERHQVMQLAINARDRARAAAGGGSTTDSAPGGETAGRTDEEKRAAEAAAARVKISLIIATLLTVASGMGTCCAGGDGLIVATATSVSGALAFSLATLHALGELVGLRIRYGEWLTIPPAATGLQKFFRVGTIITMALLPGWILGNAIIALLY